MVRMPAFTSVLARSVAPVKSSAIHPSKSVTSASAIWLPARISKQMQWDQVCPSRSRRAYSMASFGENLKHLPKVDDVERIELTDGKGVPAGIIENKPGQSGSLTVYHYLL